MDMLIAKSFINRLMIFARGRAFISGILLTGYSYFRIAHDKGTKLHGFMKHGSLENVMKAKKLFGIQNEDIS